MKRCSHNDVEPCAACLEARDALLAVRHQRRVERLARSPSPPSRHPPPLRLLDKPEDRSQPSPAPDWRSYRPPAPMPVEPPQPDLFDGGTVAAILGLAAAAFAVAWVVAFLLP